MKIICVECCQECPFNLEQECDLTKSKIVDETKIMPDCSLLDAEE